MCSYAPNCILIAYVDKTERGENHSGDKSLTQAAKL